MLEFVVRPFAQPSVANTQKIVPSVPASVSPARLQWGAAGTLPSPVSALANINLSQETYTEVSRNTENVTVVDSSDPLNSVTVANTVSMKFDKSATSNVLPSTLVSDIDVAFNAFSTEIKAAFGPYDSGAQSGKTKVNFTFHPGS